MLRRDARIKHLTASLGSASETTCPIQPVEGCGIQLQLGRGQDLVKLGDAARTRDRDDRRLAVQQPCEHDLVRRGVMLGGDVAERREPGVVGCVLVSGGDGPVWVAVGAGQQGRVREQG